MASICCPSSCKLLQSVMFAGSRNCTAHFMSLQLRRARCSRCPVLLLMLVHLEVAVHGSLGKMEVVLVWFNNAYQIFGAVCCVCCWFAGSCWLCWEEERDVVKTCAACVCVWDKGARWVEVRKHKRCRRHCARMFGVATDLVSVEHCGGGSRTLAVHLHK